MTVGVRDLARFLVFIIGGLVAIIVGAFMIRGTMHMWDKPDADTKDVSRCDDAQAQKEEQDDSADGQE